MRTRSAVVVAVASLLAASSGCTDHALPSAPKSVGPPSATLYTATVSGPSVLDPYYSSAFNVAIGVNDGGDIVGAFDFRATLWSTGAGPTPSPTPAVFVELGADAHSINAPGQIAGEYLGQAALWTPIGAPGGGYTRTDIGAQLPSPTASTAWAVSAGGKVVGSYRVSVNGVFVTRCFLWTPASPNASTGTVSLPASDFGGGFCTANDINTAGTITGASNLTSGITHAFVWDGGSTLTDVTPGSGDMSYGRAINDGGQIAGFRSTSVTVEEAAVWTPMGHGTWSVQGLGAPTLSGQSGGGMMSEASDINDAGIVVGITRDLGGVERPVLWQKVGFSELPDPYGSMSNAIALTNLIGDVVIVGGGDVVSPPLNMSRHALRWAVTLTQVMPQGCIADLVALIGQMQAAGPLRSGEAKSLLAKLDAVTRQIAQGNATPAANLLNAFINEVNALVASGRLTAEQAQPLIDGARCAIAAL